MWNYIYTAIVCVYIYIWCVYVLYIYIAILMCGLCGVLWKIIEKYEQSSPMYGNFELKKTSSTMRFRGILLSDEPIVANTVREGRDQLPLYPGLSSEIRTLRHRYVTDNCGRATDSNKLLTTPHILNPLEEWRVPCWSQVTVLWWKVSGCAS